MNAPAPALLNQLLCTGSVPLSAVGRGNLAALRSLLETGALELTRSGAGRTLVVRERAAVEALAACLYPMGLSPVVTDGHPTPRAAAVGAVRNAKRGGRAAVEPVLLRVFRPLPLQGLRGETLDAYHLTAVAGVAALTLTDKSAWSFAGTLAVVENLELFYQVEGIAPELDAALYAGGRLSGRVLAWLSGQPMQTTRIIHFGDYDPVGLSEFMRLKHVCGARATLHMPEDLSTLMQRFGKPDLLKGRNAVLLRTLRAVQDPDVRVVVSLMDETGSGLEQEALLLA